ncbi:MAG: class I SAM-dependent methyltransferase [Pseudomonadota bacterium]
MNRGLVSQTALKVAAMMLSLNADRAWRQRLPAGLADVTRELLLAANVPPYTPGVIALNERRAIYLLSLAYERLLPGVFTGIGERKIFMDRQTRAGLDTGARQVLVIGAGFDTLCLRLAPEFPGVEFVEIDHPATSEAKGRGLEAVGRPSNLRQVAADLGEQPIADLLAGDSAWSRDARSFVVAEGLLMYLNEQDVLGLFNGIADSVGAGSRFAFSWPLGVRRYFFSNAMLQIIGEPWLSATTSASLPGYIGERWLVTGVEEPLGNKAIEGFALAERAGL